MFVKPAAQKHEDLCDLNPQNRMMCLDGCKYLQVTELEIVIDQSDPFGASTRTVKFNSFRCTKKEVDMYPHKAVKKNLLTRYPEQFEGKIKCPVLCSDFEKDTSDPLFPWD